MKLLCLVLIIVALSISVYAEEKNSVPVVYFTRDISPVGLNKVYSALDRKVPQRGKVAVKLHSGEPGGTNYLNPNLIKDFVLGINGNIVECNTAYGGQRSTAAMHKQVIKDHGFDFVPFDVMDEKGSVKLPIYNGKHLEYDMVGKNYNKYNFYVILSHFKGHAMAGFGGAIKNMSIGIASADGKAYIHSAGKVNKVGGDAFSAKQEDFLEAMVEAASAVKDNLGDRILYINVMNNLSVDCDCDSSPAAPEMKDIGILASLDPVALDKACVDLVYQASDSHALKERIESRHGLHTFEYAKEIGFGSLEYKLVELN